MHAGLKSKKIALFGLGEAGSLVAIDMQKAGLNIMAYDPKPVATPAGVDRVQTPSEAVTDADVVIALTAGDDALDALEQAITNIPRTALYADFSTNSATAKLAMADRAASFGFDFVDSGSWERLAHSSNRCRHWCIALRRNFYFSRNAGSSP